MRFALIFFAALSAPAFAEDISLVAPVYSQLVVSPVPDGFISSFEHAEQGYYIHEAVPSGETTSHWTQMITVTGAEGQVTTDSSLGLVPMAQNFAAGYAAICPKSFTYQQFPVESVTGARGTIAVFFGCGAIEVPDKSPGGPGAEAAVVVLAAGAKDIYTFQWAQHFAPEAGSQTYVPEDWQPRLEKLIRGAKICDQVAGEQAPYPSCTQ